MALWRRLPPTPDAYSLIACLENEFLDECVEWREIRKSISLRLSTGTDSQVRNSNHVKRRTEKNENCDPYCVAFPKRNAHGTPNGDGYIYHLLWGETERKWMDATDGSRASNVACTSSIKGRTARTWLSSEHLNNLSQRNHHNHHTRSYIATSPGGWNGCGLDFRATQFRGKSIKLQSFNWRILAMNIQIQMEVFSLFIHLARPVELVFACTFRQFNETRKCAPLCMHSACSESKNPDFNWKLRH